MTFNRREFLTGVASTVLVLPALAGAVSKRVDSKVSVDGDGVVRQWGEFDCFMRGGEQGLWDVDVTFERPFRELFAICAQNLFSPGDGFIVRQCGTGFLLKCPPQSGPSRFHWAAIGR